MIRAREQKFQDRFDGLGICEYAAIAGAAASIIGGAMQSGAAGDAASTQANATNQAIGAQQQALATQRADLAPYKNVGNAALSRLSTLLGIQDPNGPGGENYRVPSAEASNPDFLKTVDPFYAAYGGFTAANQPGSAFQQLSPEQQLSINTAATQAWGKTQPAQSTQPGYGSLLKNFSASDLANDPIYQPAIDFATTQGEKAINARRASNGSWDSGAALKELGAFDTGIANQYGNDAFNRFTTGQNNQFSRLNSLVGTGQNSAAMTGSAASAAGNNIASLISGQGNASAAAGLAGSQAIGNGLTGAFNSYQNASLLNQLTGGGQRGDNGGYASEMSRINGQIA